MDPDKRKRLFKLGLAGLGIIVLCPIFIHFGRIWIPKVWGNLRFVNYFVAFIPTLFSILFAFIVDKDLEVHFRKMWRFGIIGCGILYSAVLWHQQTLTDQDNLQTQQKIVNDAVGKANAHSDQQFAGMQQNVGALGGQVSGLSQSLNATTSTLSSALERSTTQLNSSIGKVTQPEPVKPAVLVFSLWDIAATLEKPVVSEFLQPDNDGNYPVDLTFSNASESTSDAIDVWIQVCDGCSFAKEPAGFEKVAGSDDRVRHRIVSSLNPGVSFEKTTIVVKSAPTDGYFQIAFRYSCKTCGGKIAPNQNVTIWKGYFPKIPPRR